MGIKKDIMVLDIASGAKLMPEYSVKDDEGVDIWIKDCALFIQQRFF